MRDLPAGTVTFLFTDVEGSTRLLHEVGAERYAAILGEHRHVLREACAQTEGVEVDTQGDAFFFAFPTPQTAVAAAIEAQRKLSVPVRMGVHTGTPLVTDEGYVGTDVHEAARIASAGHGGQILVSSATAALMRDGLLRDLGEHRLKDLTAPVRIFQVGTDEHPPLKTLHRTNLPVSPTPFIGRDTELADVGELLARDDVRLLTLTGPGGSGKTRLALQAAASVAENYPHGIWWVALAPLTDVDQVAPAAAQALGGGGSAIELITDRRLLLVLDNFEHLIEAADEVASLLANCPHVNVLVTSRERLQISGEQVYPVPVLTAADARALFVARARAARPDFEPDHLTDELCARLDELPLALELAAARVGLLTTRQLLDRLGSRLDLLRGGRDAKVRQRTLRATIQWSYELLEPDEQRLLAALSVFRAPCTVDAAEQVVDADVEMLQSLLDKSLLRRTSTGRLAMLEMIRDFAAEQLTPEERDRVLPRLAAYLSELFAAAAAKAPLWDAEQIALAQAERPNVDAALAWAVDTGAADIGLALLVRLEFYWPTHDPLGARDYVDRLLALAGDQIPPHHHANALRLRGATLDMVGRSDLAARDYERAIAIFRSAGDDAAAAHLVVRLANAALRSGDIQAGRALAGEAIELARRYDAPHDEAAALTMQATVAFMQGDVQEGARLGYESAAVAERIGFTWWKGIALLAVAEHLFAVGDADGALAALAGGIEAAAVIDDRVNLPEALAHAAAIAARRGDAEVSGVLWGCLEAIADVDPRPTTTAALAAFDEHVRVVAGAEFDEGRRRGRELSLAQGVEAAVAYARRT